MRTRLLLLQNIDALLQRRGLKKGDLASWVGHHGSWIGKIMKQERGIDLDDLDRVADFFDLSAWQLLGPGISFERRRGERRSGRDRRSAQDRRERLSPLERRRR